MLNHRKASEVLAKNFNLNGSTADDYMFLSNYIDQAEDLEEKHNNFFANVKRYFELKNERYRTDDDEIELEYLRVKVSAIFFGEKGGEKK